jgi:alpha-ketoglutarate-dependent taurine dioxygenase
MSIEIRPLTGALGAEVLGVDLTSVDEAGFDKVREALRRHHVIAVRDQKLVPESLSKVARRFGAFSGNPVHQPMDGLEDIVRFERQPDDTGKVIGEDWHMDLAWLEKPPGITMLYGEVIPPVGGDTCFASLEALWRSLSPGMKSLLDGLTAVHSGKGVFAINAMHKGLTRAGSDAVENIEVEHPVVCKNPFTGNPYLFISSVLTRFKGMSEEETKPIVDYLMTRAIRPEYSCRVRWQPGTLTMWANPFLLHAAINDYPSYRRVTYRTTIEGWIPQAASPSGTGGRQAA